MELYEHQEHFLKVNPIKHLCCWDMGTGKSRAAIEWAKNQDGKLLIICPKGLVSNWERELKKWRFTSEHRIITKETFRKEIMQGKLGPYDSVVVDEAHYFAGHTSQMSKALYMYCEAYKPKIIMLTGTPFMRNALNVMRLGQILGQPWTYWQFRKEFFNDVRMGTRVVPVQKKDLITKETLAVMTASLGSVVHMSDVKDVPECNEYSEILEITKDQEKIKKQWDIDFLPAITQYTKSHQLSGGTLKGDEFSPPREDIKSEKLNRLMEIADGTDKLIVVARYNLEIQRLYEEIKKKYKNDIKFVYYITGDTPAEKRDEIIQRCRQLDNFVLIVNAHLSEGWELPEVETMIFYSHSWSLKDYLQMKARIQRINDLRPRTYVHLLVRGCIDEDVYNSLLSKEDFLIKIYAQSKK